MIAIIPGNIVQHTASARFGEVKSTTRIGDRETANVVWNGGPREPVPVSELKRVGHIETLRAQMKGLYA